jgi:F-type H+-transporting ATPase subunit b
MRRFVAFIALAFVALSISLPSVHGQEAKDSAKVKKEETQKKDDAHKAHNDDIMHWQWDTAVWTCVVFLLLLFVLSKYAWAPILEGLKNREKAISNVLDEAKKLRDENARDTAKFKAELQEAFAKIPAMMEEARRDAADLKEQLRTEGNAEVQKERTRLLRELDIARDQALQDIWNQAANVATLIASRAIGRSLTGDDHRRLVDEALDELKRTAAN